MNLETEAGVDISPKSCQRKGVTTAFAATMFMRLKPFTLAALCGLAAISAPAATLDYIGVPLLRTVTTNLNGAGIRVAQVEGVDAAGSPPPFEVNPAHSQVNQPTNLFTYHSSLGDATNYANSVGVESFHADGVAQFFFGLPNGVATNVSQVDNYEAQHFVDTYIFAASPPDPGAQIINQSFTFGPQTVPSQQSIDSAYDDVAAQYGTLYVSGAGNAGPVETPATCYNGLGVAAYLGVSSFGPTPDNGRCKPDITAPGAATSYSTPHVAGGAAVLRQAGLRGDGGSDTNSAVDLRTLKALLLNGAVKLNNWTNTPSSPLDKRYGAGVLNVFNSYMQLAGGKHANIASVTVGTGNAHPPTGATGTVSTLSGWDFTALSSSVPNDRINHYYFQVTNGLSNVLFTVTATLAWNRQQNKTDINDLDLFLYDTATSNLIAQSISGVDNVEHIYTNVPPGRYDLQVWKAGGNTANGNITASETYALAWEFFALPLTITTSNANAIVTWPIYPTGFSLQATPSLTGPTWTTLYLVRTIANGTNRVEVPLNSSNQFFRLLRPD